MNENLVNRGEFENGDEETIAFSIKQLKHNLKDTLKKSGVLSTVKAQIRQEFINGLSMKGSSLVTKKDTMDISDRILYSSVYHLLRNRQMLNSISVFTAESGLDPKLSLLSEEDIIRMVKVNSVSKTYATIHSGRSMESHDTSVVPMPPKMLERNQTTALDLIMFFCLSTKDRQKEMSTQTEAGGPSAREVLDERIHELRKTYKVSREVELLNPNKTIEERMVAFQRDCERRMQNDLSIQVAHIREHELSRVRLEEAAKHRVELEGVRKSLEIEYNRRLQMHIDKESSSAKRLSDQEHSTQRALFEARQQLQREIDDLRNRESAAVRKQELESQGVRLLELRLKESLQVIESREADIARRERQVEEARELFTHEARREAQERVQGELEILTRERAALLMERKHLSDEQATQAALLEGAKAVREQLRCCREEVVAREEDVGALQRRIQRMELQKVEEESRIRKMVEQVDPAYGTLSAAEQVIALVRQTADLQVRLASFKEAGLLQQRLAEKEQECVLAEAALREVKAHQEAEAKQCQLEREHLHNAVLTEKAKVASYAHKLEELRQLLGDKTKAIDSLRRQLEGGSGGGECAAAGGGSHYRSSAGRTSAGATGGVGLGASRREYSSSDFKAIEFLRSSGHFIDFERNVNGNGKPVEQLSEVLDSILHKLNANAAPAPVLAPVAAMPTHSAWPVSVPVTSAPSQVSAQAPPSHTTGLTDSITSNSQAEEQAQLSAALVRERQLAAERTSELTASLQREQLKAAELQTQIEQQKLASARLALQAERERLQQAADATAAETERAERIRAERAREQESLRTEDAARRTQAARPTFTAADGDEDITVHGSRPSPAAPVLHSTSTLSATRAVSHTPAPTSTSHTQAVLPTTAPSTTTSSSSSSSDVVAEFEFIEGGRAEDTSVSHQQDAEDRRARDLRDKEPDLTSSAEAAQREVDADAYRLQHKQQRDEEDLRATEEARVAAAAEEKQAQVRRRLREQEEREEREEQQRLEKERLEKQEQEKEQARQQKEVDDAAALAQEAASVAVAKAEAEAAALAVEQATADAAAAATAQQAQKDEEEAERVQREKEEQRELSERAEKEAEEDAARETTEAAAQAAAEVEAVKAAEEQRRRDEQEVNEARARVLARRQKKKELDGQQPFLSASLPTSLQAAAAAASGGGHGGEGTFGVGHSADFSGINTTVSGSHNVSLMGGAVGGVSTATSLDSGTGFRSQPARNLFGNNPSFQSLQDSDSSTDSGEKMEVGDVSDDHEGDRSVW